MPLTSPPAQKAVPAPVRTSAPTAGSFPKRRTMRRRAGVSSSERAFRASGRLRVRVATPSRSSPSSSSVPVSIALPAVSTAVSSRDARRPVAPRPLRSVPAPVAAAPAAYHAPAWLLPAPASARADLIAHEAQAGCASFPGERASCLRGLWEAFRGVRAGSLCSRGEAMPREGLVPTGRCT